MNPSQQAACSSLVAGLVAASAYCFLFANPENLAAVALLAAGIFFPTLATTLWTHGKMTNRVSDIEQRLAADLEKRSGK